MRTLLAITLLSISACSSTKPTLQTTLVPQEASTGRPNKELLECQLEVFNEYQARTSDLSRFSVHSKASIDQLVLSLKKQTLHCYRYKSDAEEMIDAVVLSKE